MTATARAGTSILELIIIVAVLGILLAVGFVQLRPPAARAFGNDVKSQVEQARFEAVKRNQPVAVQFADGRLFTSLDTSDLRVVASCSPDATVIVQRFAGSYGNVTVTPDSSWGVVWLPSGQGRTCDGSPAIGSTLRIDDGRTVTRVTVSDGGRVSVE